MWKLDDGLCPDCGKPPETRGYMENEEDPEVLGDLCTHPCHDDAEEATITPTEHGDQA